MIEAGLKRLNAAPDRTARDAKPVYDDLENHYRERLSALNNAPCDEQSPAQPDDRFEHVARRLRDAERAAAIELRDQNRIGDETLRNLLHELDLLDVRDDARHAT